MNKKKHEEYLKSSHWQHFRIGLLKTAKGCHVCPANLDLLVAHKWYRRPKDKKSVYYSEKRSDVVVLCRSCHDQIREWKLFSVLNRNKILNLDQLERAVEKSKALRAKQTSAQEPSILEVFKKRCRAAGIHWLSESSLKQRVLRSKKNTFEKLAKNLRGRNFQIALVQSQQRTRDGLLLLELMPIGSKTYDEMSSTVCKLLRDIAMPFRVIDYRHVAIGEKLCVNPVFTS